MVESVFRVGDSGPAVEQIVSVLARLRLLEETHDDYFDEQVERAVRGFQQERGLKVDGLVGSATFRRLEEARWSLGDRILTYLPGGITAGDDVFALQQRLLDLGFDVGRVDGYFGAQTAGALREFQRNVGIAPDGTCGPATLAALGRLSPRVSGGTPNALRTRERIREAGPQLTGKVVVVDPARCNHLPEGYRDAASGIVHDVAARIEGRLIATGVQAFLSAAPGRHRRPESDRAAAEDLDRARFANEAGADLCVSVAVDVSENAGACGIASYFFGGTDEHTWSNAGERLADLIQREAVARTDLVDLRTHPKTWEFLRRTRMPAVAVDLGYLSHPQDAARLHDPGFRDVLAEAVVVAVQRYYLDPDADATTGVLRLSDLRAALRTESAG